MPKPLGIQVQVTWEEQGGLEGGQPGMGWGGAERSTPAGAAAHITTGADEGAAPEC